MLSMKRLVAAAGVLVLSVAPVWGEVSLFVASVGFDDEAYLESGAGIGVRWGRSSRLIGGETSLLVARPERRLEAGGAVAKETATALLYEGRVMLSIPVGKAVPFAAVGFGGVTVTSTELDLPANEDQALAGALDGLSDIHHNPAISYGGGVRVPLARRFDLRADLRQYLVFSVESLAARALEDRTGLEVPGDLADQNTVTYEELSIGVNIRF